MVRSVAVLVLILAACGGSGSETTIGSETTVASTVSAAPGSGCADVVGVEVAPEGNGTFRVDVTVRSADTGWEKYADAWEVRGLDGTVLGTRILAHPHVDEQPFTRSLTGVGIPDGVEEVQIVARDLEAGFCGRTMTVAIPSG